jgi:DNA-directed RNA polymerase II subunit RPB9
MATPQSTTSYEGAEDKKLEQITFRFCSECSNMLYPKEDQDAHKLQFTCRTCQYTEDAQTTCVFRNVLNTSAGETAGVTQDVGSDPTVSDLLSLPVMCLFCGCLVYCVVCGDSNTTGRAVKGDDASTITMGVDDTDTSAVAWNLPDLDDTDSCDENMMLDNPPESDDSSDQQSPNSTGWECATDGPSTLGV